MKKYSPYNPSLNGFNRIENNEKNRMENTIMYAPNITIREKQLIKQKKDDGERIDKTYYDFKNYDKLLSKKQDYLKIKTNKESHSIQFDTKDRNLQVYPSPTDVTVSLPTLYREVSSFKISNFRFLNTIQEFSTTNGNVDLYIQEKGRDIKKITIDNGSYKNIGELQAQINEKLRSEPEFYHYPNGFSDFVEKFRISGNFSLNFNDFQYFKKDERINSFIARRRDQETAKGFSLPEDDIIIPGTVDTYFNTELRDTIGFTTYTVEQAKIAYYYPVLKKLIENKETEGFSLPNNVVIDGVTYTDEQLEDRILIEFQGLDDEVINYLIDENIDTLNSYRLNNTFYCNLANEYVVSVDEQTNKIKISSTALSRSILEDINVKIDEFTKEVQNDLGYTDSSGATENVEEARELFAQETELYNIFQSANASNIGIDYNTLSVDQFLDKNTKITPKLVTNENFDSIVKELTNDILDVSNNVTSSIVIADENLDYPDIRGCNYFNSNDIVSGISGTIYQSSNLDVSSFININSNITNISFKSDIQSGNYNIFTYNPESNFTGSLFIAPLFEENPDNYKIRYSNIPDQLDNDKQVITQSNLTLEPIIFNDITEESSNFTISGLSTYKIAPAQKLRFRFTPTETKRYTFVTYPSPSISTQLVPTIHLYGELSQFIGDQQTHYFTNENTDYYIQNSDTLTPEVYKFNPMIYDISNSTSNIRYAEITETLEAGRTYYYTVRGQNVNVFNNGVYVGVFDPDLLTLPEVNSSYTPKTPISSQHDTSLNEINTLYNTTFTCKDYILGSNPTYNNIDNDNIEIFSNITNFNSSYIKLTELNIDSSSQSIEYSNISIPDNSIYFSFHLLLTDENGSETGMYEDDISRCLFEISGNDGLKCILSNDILSITANDNVYSTSLDLSFGSDISNIIGSSNFLNYVVELDASKNANVYVRLDTEFESDDYVLHTFSYDMSDNIFNTSRNIKLFNTYDNNMPFFSKIHAYSVGSNSFFDISETYPDYVLSYESTYDSTNKIYVGDIDVEDSMILANKLIPENIEITAFINTTNNDVIMKHENIAYYANVSGEIQQSANNGISIQNREHLIIPYFENNISSLPMSFSGDVSNIQSSIISIFCNPSSSNVSILSSDYETIGYRDSVYIDISDGVLYAGFENEQNTEISGSISSYIGQDTTINYIQNINVQYPDASAGVAFELTTTLSLFVNDTEIASKIITETPDLSAGGGFEDISAGAYLRPKYDLLIGKRNNKYFNGNLYNVTFFKTINQSVFTTGFLAAHHERNMKNDNFKNEFTIGLEKYIVARYDLNILTRNSLQTLLVPNSYTRFNTFTSEFKNTNTPSNQEYKQALQFYNYDVTDIINNPYITDVSSTVYTGSNDISAFVFPETYRTLYNNSTDISKINHVCFLGNANLISRNYYLDDTTNTIYTTSGNSVSTISGEDLSNFNTLTLTNNFRQLQDSFSMYIDISLTPISGEELTLVQFFNQTEISQDSPRLYYSGTSNIIFGSENSDDLTFTYSSDYSYINHQLMLTYNHNTNEFSVRIFGDRTISGEETMKRFNKFDMNLNNFVFGCDLSLNNLFQGEIREIRLFNEPLNMTQSLELEQIITGSNSYSNFPNFVDDRLGESLSNVVELRLNSSQTQSYRFDDISSYTPTFNGLPQTTHYILNNKTNASSYEYTNHELSGNQVYVYDLSNETNISFCVETSFINRKSTNNFTLLQTENFVLDVNFDLSGLTNQLLLYTGSTSDPLFSNEQIKIPQNQLTFVSFSYDSSVRKILLDINGQHYETDLPNDITVHSQKVISLYGLHMDTISSRVIYNTKYSQRLVNSYANVEVKHIRIHDKPCGKRQFLIERSMNMYEQDDLSGYQSRISYGPINISSVTSNEALINGSAIYEITPAESGFYNLETSNVGTANFIYSIYTSSDKATYDISNYNITDFRNSNQAEYVIDTSFNPIVSLNSNNNYYIVETAYDNSSSDVSMAFSIDKVIDFRDLSGIQLSNRLNTSNSNLYELRDLEYIAKSRLIGKTDSKYYNVVNIPEFLPDASFTRNNEDFPTNNPIYTSGIDLSFVVYDNRNNILHKYNFDDGMRYIYTDTGNPEIFIYDDLSDLSNDLSSTNFRTLDIDGTSKWGGETGSLMFSKDKLSANKVYPGFSNIDMFNNNTYYIAVRSAYPTQNMSYKLNLEGTSQQLGFRTITIDQLLTDISNTYTETSKKEFDLYYPSYIFLGELLADELIPYNNTTTLDKLTVPTHTKNTKVISDTEITNTLIPLLIQSFNKFTDNVTEKSNFSLYLNELPHSILLNYMSNFITSFATALNIDQYDSSVSSHVKLVNYSTQTLQTQINNLFITSLRFDNITYNNNYNIHHICLNTFEEIFEALDIQREDKLYDVSPDNLLDDLSGREFILNDGIINLAARFFDFDLSNLYEHSLSPGISISKVDGNDSQSLSGQIHSYFNTISGNLVSSTSNFITSLVTDVDTSSIEIRDLSEGAIKSAVNNFFVNDLGFISYTADPSNNYYTNKTTGIINQFFVDIGISTKLNQEYEDNYRASLIGADSFFRNESNPEKTLTLGNQIINTFDPIEITVSGYISAYEENGSEDLRSINDQLKSLESELNPDLINEQVRDKLKLYLQEQYDGILPDTFADRERFNELLEMVTSILEVEISIMLKYDYLALVLILQVLHNMTKHLILH
jgi:hypothetical protein